MKMPIRTIIYHSPSPSTHLPTRVTFIRQQNSILRPRTYRLRSKARIDRLNCLALTRKDVRFRWPYHAAEIPSILIVEQVQRQTIQAARAWLASHSQETRVR